MSSNITITKERYLDLLICEMELSRLENGGVDNWAWYGDSLNPPGETSYDEEIELLRKEVFGEDKNED